MGNDWSRSRRKLILGIGAGAVGSILGLGRDQAFAFSVAQPIEVNEDLMQEHGVLRRLLMIYDELARRFRTGFKDPDNCTQRATELIVQYIEGHHERIEELFIFPLLTRSNLFPDLVDTLVTQHRVGRDITVAITNKFQRGAKLDATAMSELARLMESYSLMFQAHASREDTVVFPALHKVMEPEQYQEFGLKIQNVESKMKTADLADILKQVQTIETALGLADLSHFTARVYPHTPTGIATSTVYISLFGAATKDQKRGGVPALLVHFAR